MALLDGRMLHLRAYSGYGAEDGAAFEARFPMAVDAATMFGRAILTGGPVQMPDSSTDPNTD